MVPVAGLDLRLHPGMGADRCFNQCLHWLPQMSTGHLHLNRFDSVIDQKQGTPMGRPVFGAGGRTRTGTLSPAVDFESTTSTIPSHRQVCYLLFIRQPPLTIYIVATFGGLMSPSFAVPGDCPWPS